LEIVMPLNRFRCSLRLALLAAAVAGLSGCDSSGIGRNRTPEQRRSDFPIEAADWGKIGYRLDWVGYPAITGSLPIQFAEAYPDIVMTLEGGSQLSILEATNGNRRASDQLANPLTKFVGLARDNSQIYAASESEVFSLDPQTGILHGRQRTEKIVSTEPVQFGNLLIFGTPSGEVLAHLAGGSVGGVKVWGFATGSSVEHKPALIGSAVGCVSIAGQVTFLDAQSGNLMGRNTIFAGSDTNPVADNNFMYVASLDQSVYAFNPFGGAVAWRYRTASPLRTQPTAFGGKLYCSVPGEGLVAFEGASGSVLWRCRNFPNGVVVAINKGNLVVFNGEEAALVDAQRGDIIDRTKLPGVSFFKTDKFVDGNLYAISKSGVIAKFLKR
jgi:outer membrane protein assembly factor BamB